MRQRLLYLVKFYLLTILLFIAAKMIFMMANHEGHYFTLTDMANVISHGLTLDLSTSLYFLIVPFLLTLASIWWDNQWIRRILNIYYVLVAVILISAFITDTSLYPFWGFKLDSTCLQYLDTPAEISASVSITYIALRSFLLIVGIILVYLLYHQIPTWNKRASHRIVNTLFGLLLIPCFIIGIRGGLDESTTNIGQVYYAQDQFLNHAAVNPVFSFLSSFESTVSDIPNYQFMSETECAETMKGLYFTDSTAPDTLLNTKRPNIIIILLESCGGIFTEDIGKRKDVMPHFSQLVEEGIYFSNFYANSFRTDRGTVCTWSGYPSFPRSSVMKMPAKTRFLPGIANTLKKEGYKTYYLYGGDINFTNMRSYLVTTGFEQLYWKKDYTQDEQASAKWGVRDDITFGTLKHYLTENVPAFPDASQSPHLIGYSTLSSHEPWDVPTHRLDDEILNAFNYLDECLFNFIRDVKQTPQWENLLVVLLPDHGFSHLGVEENHPEHDHVPMLWLGGAIQAPKRIPQLCNQTDLAATLLGQLGLAHDDFKFSRDILSKGYTYPFAIHTYNNCITMRDSTGFAIFDLNAQQTILDDSRDSEALLRKGKAILQTTANDLRTLGTKN